MTEVKLHESYCVLNILLKNLIGVKLTLSALIDGKNINAGGHKLGLGLELEA